MKLRKLISFLLVSIVLLLVCGCVNNSKTTYKVKYITNGGIIVGNYQEEFTDYENYNLALVKKDGFIFQGWYEDDVKIDKLYANKDYTLEAKWLSEIDNPNTRYVEKDDISIESVIINNENIEINVSLEKNLQVGLLIVYGEQLNVTHQTEDAFNFYLEEKTLLFGENLINNVTSTITIRPYYMETILETTTVNYGKSKTIQLIDIIENASSELEKAILDAYKIIYEVSLTMNTAKYTVTSNNSALYNASIKKPVDYIYIVTNITVVEGYTFFKNVKLIVNDKEVTTGIIISVDYKKITYTMDDPNWTDIW